MKSSPHAIRRDGLLVWGAALLLLGQLAAAAGAAERKPATRPTQLTTYQTQYYVICSDLDPQMVKEAAARLTAMARQCRRRTKGFSRVSPKPMPFYLFADRRDYYAAGGLAGSLGTFTPRGLMATAAENGKLDWRILQHEAFHQFAYQTISKELPVWLSEGLAEYFTEGIWTGDNFVTGLVPPGRLRRVQEMIRDNKLVPFRKMMLMSPAEWNADIQRRNYDQAWSMVHFLILADRGRYQKAFSQFVNDVAAHRPWEIAFQRRFGPDAASFQKKYARWWASLNRQDCTKKYCLAAVQTLTSFLARASARRQSFPDARAFLAAAREGRLRADPTQWLPPSLLADALKMAEKSGTWTLKTTGPRLSMILTARDGTTFTGTFELRDGRVEEVKVTVSRPDRTNRPP